MSWITSRLAGPIAAGLALILAISLAATILTKNGQLREARDQVAKITGERDQAKADLLQCRENRITLEEATRRQNAAVDAYRVDAERRIAAVDAAAAKAKSEGLAAVSRATAILNRKGSTCEDADALIAWSLFK